MCIRDRLNPLLTNVVKGDALTSSLTAGQVVKAVSSFCGPFIAAFAAGTLGNWQYLFPIFALITLLSAAWLLCTPIREEAEAPQASPVGATFALLKDRTVLLLFLGIDVYKRQHQEDAGFRPPQLRVQKTVAAGKIPFENSRDRRAPVGK